jgi:hypothetical protein
MKLNSFRVAIPLALLLVAAFGQTVNARKIEGFEPGDPAVTSTGDAGTRGTYETGVPPEATTQYLITTIASNDGDGLSSQSGTNAVSNAALQTFFNGITLTGGFQGSGILIPFTIAAGETILTFQFDFLTNERDQSGRADFGFAAIFNSSNTLQGTVNRFVTYSAAMTLSFFGPQTPFIRHTGLQIATLSLSGLAPGNYTLGIGVDDAAAVDGASGLLLDNFQVVPEPSIMALTIGGMALLLVGFRWRAKRA